MPRLAAIDIGSNSALLLIAESLPGGDWQVLVDTRRTVRMTQTPQAPGTISGTAIEALEAALTEYQEIIDAHGSIARIAVGATQALRAAENGQEIAARLHERFGWSVEILSADQEAELSFLAAASGLLHLPTNRQVIDVGGGSTEIIRGQGQSIEISTSVPLGAVSVSTHLGLAEPTGRKELERYAEQLDADLQTGLAAFPLDTRRTVLVGGTAATLAALSLEQKVFDPQAIHGVELTTDWIAGRLGELAGLHLEDRRERLQFDPDRAEIIVGGVLILERILTKLQVQAVVVSNRGLRWGLLQRAADTIGAD